MAKLLGFRNLVVLVMVLFALGCGAEGPARAPVSGMVTLDGKPVDGAAVLFMPAEGGRPARATTDAQGRFELTTFKSGDGALVGRHAVGVTKTETAPVQGTDGRPPSAMQGRRPKVTWLLPQKYANPASSGLTVEVQSGMEPVTLELTSR